MMSRIPGLSVRIRKIRGNLTQAEFAAISGVTQGTVNKYEKGTIFPGEDVLNKIAAHGGVTIEWLLHGEEKRAPLAGREALTLEQVRLETLYLGFRTREGVPLEVIESQSGWGPVLSRLQAAGLLRLTNGRVAATPRGLVVADRLPLLFVD